MYNNEEASWKKESSYFQPENGPVVCVSWYDALAYTKWLSEKTGKDYRLPTEAEWEYVARAGTTGPFSFKDNISYKNANYQSNYTYAAKA